MGGIWVLAPGVVIFAVFVVGISSDYFFMNSTIEGLSQEGWQRKCVAILNGTKLTKVVFPVRSLCTQLKCLRGGHDLHDVHIGFDLCVRSSNRCFYAEPNYDYPYPECCPKKDCSRLRRRFKRPPK